MRLCLGSALALGVHCVTGLAVAQATDTDSVRVRRLAAVGRLWGVVRYFHPAFLSRDVPWDSAVLATIPRVREAGGSAQYRTAVNAMLRVLGDPGTSIRDVEARRAIGTPVHDTGSTLTSRWTRDSTLVVRIPCCFQENFEGLRHAASLIERARHVVFDLRGPPPAIRGEADDEFSGGIDGLLAYRSIAVPLERRRMNRSFSAVRGDAVGGLVERGGQIFRGREDNIRRSVAFLVYADSDLPSVSWALQNAGQGSIVLDDSRGSRLLQDPSLPDPPVFPVDMGEGLVAEVRVADFSGQPHGLLSPDTVITGAGPGDRPLDAALAMVRRQQRARIPRALTVRTPAKADDDFSERRFPDLPLRILAAYRFWNAVRWFYPSAMPPGARWDDALPASLRLLEQARDTIEYWSAIAAMTRRLADGHAQPGSAIGQYVAGRAGPRLLLRYIEGRVVVTRVLTDSATAAAGPRVGDVILRVDGEDVESRMSRIAQVTPGTSRPGEPNGPPVNQLLFGDPGTVARLAMDRGGGEVVEVSVPRVIPACLPQSCAPRAGDPIRLLTPDIGYVDLYHVTESMVDSMFEALSGTRAIVFDGRGRNAGAPATIAARLATTSRFEAGRFRRPVVTSPDTGTRTIWEGQLLLEASERERYRGRTVLLIDERAFSNAEQVAFFFGGANGTTLIGSATAGGIGALTPVRLPGGIAPTIPGSEGLMADGRPVVRSGIPPDILVRPTIAGIRAGRDEVLERALSFLEGR